MMNKTCLPISYADSFYEDVVKSKNENLNKFAYHNGFVVGAICARVEPLPCNGSGRSDTTNDDNNNNNNSGCRIYIMTLAVLAAYRGRGIGQKLVQSLLDYYNGSIQFDPDATEIVKSAAETANEMTVTKKDKTLMKDVKEITLHVQISNNDAINFYKEKFDFKQCEQVDNYYKRIDPPHCFVLRKIL
jgi:ribosomal protein S18 acetylase RimI-like enzyme